MKTARQHARPFADLLRLFVGPGIWFTHFATIYLAEALLCAPAINRPGAMIWIGAAATTTALVVLLAGAFALRRADRSQRHDATFLHDATLWLVFLSALAVIWTAIPLTALPVCAPPAG